MRRRVVVDTNVLVYATFEDSEHHEEAHGVLQRHEVVIPYIVLYEYLWVLAKLTRDPAFLELKLKELRDFELVCEDPETVRRGVALMIGDGAPPGMLNDYIVLSAALHEGALATYDSKLRSLASRSKIAVIP
jgi:predicted nucleic acid-binding protein